MAVLSGPRGRTFPRSPRHGMVAMAVLPELAGGSACGTLIVIKSSVIPDKFHQEYYLGFKQCAAQISSLL